jgi:hypothetical protein
LKRVNERKVLIFSIIALSVNSSTLSLLVAKNFFIMNKKRLIALELLASKGLKRSVYEPHHLRLLWYFGFDTPPPHFASFFSNILMNGTFFGIFWWVFREVFKWLQSGIFQSIDIGAIVTVGAVYGFGMAVYYATWHGLSS